MKKKKKKKKIKNPYEIKGADLACTTHIIKGPHAWKKLKKMGKLFKNTAPGGFWA
jgi:hypothetical protein